MHEASASRCEMGQRQSETRAGRLGVSQGACAGMMAMEPRQAPRERALLELYLRQLLSEPEIEKVGFLVVNTEWQCWQPPTFGVRGSQAGPSAFVERGESKLVCEMGTYKQVQQYVNSVSVTPNPSLEGEHGSCRVLFVIWAPRCRMPVLMPADRERRASMTGWAVREGEAGTPELSSSSQEGKGGQLFDKTHIETINMDGLDWVVMMPVVSTCSPDGVLVRRSRGDVQYRTCTLARCNVQVLSRPGTYLR